MRRADPVARTCFGLADLGRLIARVRRLLDLDADPIAVDSALSGHRELAPLVAGPRNAGAGPRTRTRC